MTESIRNAEQGDLIIKDGKLVKINLHKCQHCGKSHLYDLENNLYQKDSNEKEVLSELPAEGVGNPSFLLPCLARSIYDLNEVLLQRWDQIIVVPGHEASQGANNYYFKALSGKKLDELLNEIQSKDRIIDQKNRFINKLSDEAKKPAEAIPDTVFRPVDADAYVMNNNLVNKKRKKVPFNLQNRKGVAYSDNKGILFVPKNTPNNASVKGVLSVCETLAYNYIGTKQNKMPKDTRFAPETVLIKYVGSKKDIQDLQKWKDKVQAETKTDLEDALGDDDAQLPMPSKKEAFYKIAKTQIRKIPKRILVGILFSVIPGSIFFSTLYYGIGAAKNLNKLRRIEQYLTEHVGNADTSGSLTAEFNDITTALNAIDASEYERFTNFFESNGLTPADFGYDMDGLNGQSDGFFDRLFINGEWVERDDLISLLTGSVPQEDLDKWSDLINNIDNLEQETHEYSTLLNNIMGFLQDEADEITGLISGSVTPQEYFTNVLQQLSSTQFSVDMATGVSISALIGTIFSLTLGGYVEKRFQKKMHGSKLRVLSDVERQNLYKHNVIIEGIELSVMPEDKARIDLREEKDKLEGMLMKYELNLGILYQDMLNVKGVENLEEKIEKHLENDANYQQVKILIQKGEEKYEDIKKEIMGLNKSDVDNLMISIISNQ